MTDKRAFAKFDVGYLDNPKMMDVMDASSNAILMHFASILYCAQHLTDGVVASKAMQRKTGGTDADVRILLDAGLWHDPEHGCETCPQPPAGKVYVHDFLEHNRAAEEAKRVSEKRSKAASARWDKGKKPMQIALQDAVQNDDVCNAEREREKEILNTPSTAAPNEAFEGFWSAYPRKIGKAAAVKAYRKAVKATTPEKILEGVRQLRLEVAGKDPQYTPYPASWLNAGRWDDEPVKPSVPAGPWSKEFHAA